jgi:hypothetical protein
VEEGHDLRAELGRALALARLLAPSEDAARAAVQRAFTDVPPPARGGVPPRVQSVVRGCLALSETAAQAAPLERPGFLEDGHHIRHPVAWDVPGDDSELADHVRTCLSGLPPRERIVFLLRDIQGLRRDDVACCLGWREEEVQAVLHRARQALRGQLDRRLGTGVT